jgi:sporulation protein YlmC with PRC-barrel domain
MTDLIRATDVIGMPVVTLDGVDLGEVKDVVLGAADPALLGFTLRKHKALGGQLGESLPWSAVHAIGQDAVMVKSSDVLVEGEVAPGNPADSVIDIDVLTDQGDRLGHLIDVIIEPGQPAKVVGFEMLVERTDSREQRRVLVPNTDEVAVSGRALIVPDTAMTPLRSELADLS